MNSSFLEFREHLINELWSAYEKAKAQKATQNPLIIQRLSEFHEISKEKEEIVVQLRNEKLLLSILKGVTRMFILKIAS